MTDNLNFANPHNPELFWQLRESVEGLAEGCREFGTPVTGGNVSLYNQSPAGPIDPTPTVGMVGLIDDAKHITTQAFKSAGDVIILAGPVFDVAATPSSPSVAAAPSPRGDASDEATLQRPAAGAPQPQVAGAPQPRCCDLSLGASHYMKVVHGQQAGRTPRLSFDLEKRVQAAVLGLTAHGATLAATLAEVSDPFEHSIERAMA